MPITLYSVCVCMRAYTVQRVMLLSLLMLYYALAFVNLWIAFSISMSIMCYIKFVQHFALQISIIMTEVSATPDWLAPALLVSHSHCCTPAVHWPQKEMTQLTVGHTSFSLTSANTSTYSNKQTKRKTDRVWSLPTKTHIDWISPTCLIVVLEDDGNVHVDDEEIGDDYVGHHKRNGSVVIATLSLEARNPGLVWQLQMSFVAATHKTQTKGSLKNILKQSFLF